MNVITIQSEAFQEIINSIQEIKETISVQNNQQPLSEKWLDIQEVCFLLKISKRTLQSYRDKNLLPYSQIGGKIYFRATDIEDYLQKHYKKIA